MRDPFAWSLPLGRVFGITVRLHLLFLLFILVMWLRAATDKDLPAGSAATVLFIQGLLFLSVLLHEFGHCYGARLVEGDADEIMLWPLGGLAQCDVPHTPRAHFVTAAMGPMVNLLLCVIIAVAVVFCGLQPSFDPRIDQLWNTKLVTWDGGRELSQLQLEWWQLWLARFFWINWMLLLLNVCLVGFPLDGGRMLQALLWPRMGYHRSMQTAIFVGYLVMFLVAVFALVMNETLYLCLAAFIYFACKQQWIVLETGGEESLFGYDFSQGYTSLERDQPPRPRVKKANFVIRWLQRRAAAKLRRDQERQEADERRMDELLEKIQRDGKHALTDEENRFLKRVADKYRNRH
jgi:stage IV sporulation protein FB